MWGNYSYNDSMLGNFSMNGSMGSPTRRLQVSEPFFDIMNMDLYNISR